MKKRAVFIVLILLVFMFCMTGCLPGDGKATVSHPAGFLWGIWHGWMAPISLIGEIFNKSIRLYETANTGWWYDFGYYIAIISGFGGLSLFRSKKSKHDGD